MSKISIFRHVLPSVEPGYLLNALPEDAPEHPEEWKDVLKDFNQNILPGVSTDVNQKSYNAYLSRDV